MKLEQVSKHIWSLRTWALLPLRVWLVLDADGVTLVDAGMPSMAKAILEGVDRLQAGPLRRILLTHGHQDHLGGVPAIVAQRQVPVFAHRLELPYIEGKLAYPRRKKAVAGLPAGMAAPLPEDAAGGLARVTGLLPWLTPGHSPGHVAYYHEEDRVLLAGDMFSSRHGKLRPPVAIFTADMATALRSGAIVTRLQPERVEITHSGPVLRPAEHWDPVQ